jgi:protein ImuA
LTPPAADSTAAEAAARRSALLWPERLHPALWRASQVGAGRAVVGRSGFAALDAELPGGGWPHRALTELLLPHPGLGEMRLLAPALAAISPATVADPALPTADPQLQPGSGSGVMLFDPPALIDGWVLAQLGIAAQQVLVVRGRSAALRRLGPGADLLWALEQTLRSGHAGAVLAWLPGRLKADVLRRLQLAAQAHDGPAFLLRDLDAALRPSAAPLRIVLQAGGIDELILRIVKRRGPPPAQPLRLALPAVLAPHLRLRATAQRRPGAALPSDQAAGQGATAQAARAAAVAMSPSPLQAASAPTA